MEPHPSQPPTKSSSSGASPDPFAPRTRGPAHEMLEAFVGTWRVEGRNAPQTPGASGSPVTGEQTYEWLPGRLFLSARWRRRFPEGRHAGTAILGFDPEGGGFFAHHYDSLGHARQYQLTSRGRVWRFTGPHERATIAFAADGASFTETWQHAPDGATWRPLCELEATRAPVPAAPSEDVIRGYYEAFAAGDRDAVERVLADDFRFTSPSEDALDLVAYWERCWPGHERLRAISVEDIAVADNEAFVTYVAVMRDGRRVRTTDRLGFAGEKIASVEVYVGATRDEHGELRPLRHD